MTWLSQEGSNWEDPLFPNTRKTVGEKKVTVNSICLRQSEDHMVADRKAGFTLVLKGRPCVSGLLTSEMVCRRNAQD